MAAVAPAPDRRPGGGRGLPRVPEAFFPADPAWRRLERLPSVVVVQAPRGFGKTTTAASWLRRPDLPDHDLVWLTLPPGVEDRGAFWAVLHEAVVRAGYESPGDRADGWERLARTVRARRRHLVLVVDSYERQRDEAVDAELLELAQAHERLHVVILTRDDRPAVALARSVPDAVVLHTPDLALDAAQVVMLGRALGRPVPPGQAEELASGTAGWPGVLRVLLLTSSVGRDGAVVPDLSAVASYLRVVLAELDGNGFADALLALAVPDTLTSDLAAELAGAHDGAAAEPVLARLTRTGLLVHDGDGRYTCPPVLRDAARVLLQEDDPARARHLHAAMARRRAGEHDAVGAVRHAVAARDEDLLRRLVEEGWPEVLIADRHLVRTALRQLPDMALRSSALLVALRDHVGPRDVPRSFLEVLRPEGAGRTGADADAGSGPGPGLASGSGAGAGASVSDDGPAGLPECLLALGRVELRAASLVEAAFAFHEAVRRAPAGTAPAVLREAASGLAVALALLGHHPAADRWLRLCARHPGGSASDLERAADVAVPALRRLDALEQPELQEDLPEPDGDRWPGALSWHVVAEAAVTSGDAARHVLDAGVPAPPGNGWADLAGTLRTAAEVDLHLSANHVARARELVVSAGGSGPERPWAEAVRARVALYAGDGRLALELTRDAAELAPVRPRDAVAMALVHAVAAHRTGDDGDAAEALRLAARVAERSGLLRDLLLVPRGDLGAVAATMPEGCPVLDRPEVRSATPPFPEPVRPEPLSARELLVLRELASGRPAAIIAARLYVSESTVKTQVGSIYRKLRVHSRADALERARLLGLLDD